MVYLHQAWPNCSPFLVEQRPPPAQAETAGAEKPAPPNQAHEQGQNAGCTPSVLGEGR